MRNLRLFRYRNISGVKYHTQADGVFDPCGSRRMDVQAYPPGSLPAEIKSRRKKMIRKKSELDRIHKEKCRQLKAIRVQMAKELGVELNQRECTYTGYCSGTCPKCMSEEAKLNAALFGQQKKEKGIVRKTAAAGLTAATMIGLAGCTALGGKNPDDSYSEELEYVSDEESDAVQESMAETIWEEDVTEKPEESDDASKPDYLGIEGDIEIVEPSYEMLEGDVYIPGETCEEEENAAGCILEEREESRGY